jgi:hypothetical protein
VEETSHNGRKRKAITAAGSPRKESCRSLYKGTRSLCDGVAENKENRKLCSATTRELSRPPRIFGGWGVDISFDDVGCSGTLIGLKVSDCPESMSMSWDSFYEKACERENRGRYLRTSNFNTSSKIVTDVHVRIDLQVNEPVNLSLQQRQLK